MISLMCLNLMLQIEPTVSEVIFYEQKIEQYAPNCPVKFLTL